MKVFCVIAMICSLFTGTVLTAHADNTPAFGMNWEYNNAFWTVGTTIVGQNNIYENANVAYTPNSVTSNDYSVIATFSGTDTYPQGANDKAMSLVPWRKDDGNLIVVSLMFQKEHWNGHNNKLLNCKVSEFKDGAIFNPTGSSDATINVDFWLDGAGAPCGQLAPTTAFTVKIVKKGSDSTQKDTYTIIINDQQVRTYVTPNSYNVTANQTVGLHSWNETTTYTNVSVSSDTTGGSTGGGGGTPPVGGSLSAFDKTFTANTNVWSVSGGKLVGANGGWQTDYAVAPAGITGNYVFTATISGTGVSTDSASGEIVFGVIPWYVDSNNYLMVTFKWTNESNGLLSVVDFVNSQDLATFNTASVEGKNAASLRASDTLNIKVEKKLDDFGSGKDYYYVYINDELVHQDSLRASATSTADPYVGVWVHKDTMTVSALSVSALTLGGGGSGGGEDFGGGDGGFDFGSGDYVETPTVGGGNPANDFAKFLVPWGVVVLCVICVIPFLVGIIKKAVYNAKKK